MSSDQKLVESSDLSDEIMNDELSGDEVFDEEIETKPDGAHIPSPSNL